MMQDITPVAGDLILVQAPGRKSLNRILQSTLTLRRATFSHLAIAIDGGFALHSMPLGGVQEIEIPTLLDPKNTSTFMVLRRKDFDGDRELQIELRDALFYHLEEPYNPKFMFRMRDVGSYCSEYAAKAYARIKRPLFKKRPQFVLPVHVEGLRRDESWLEVTALYQAGLGLQPSSIVQSLIDKELAPIRQRVREAQLLTLAGERQIRKATRTQNAVIEVQHALANLTGQKVPPAPQTHPYWDSPALMRRKRRTRK